LDHLRQAGCGPDPRHLEPEPSVLRSLHTSVLDHGDPESRAGPRSRVRAVHDESRVRIGPGSQPVRRSRTGTPDHRGPSGHRLSWGTGSVEGFGPVTGTGLRIAVVEDRGVKGPQDRGLRLEVARIRTTAGLPEVVQPDRETSYVWRHAVPAR